MAHCEAPACGHRAGGVVVHTPYGEPVVCDEHAMSVLAVFGEHGNLTVAAALKVMWLPTVLAFGPVTHEARACWLEGRPALDLLSRSVGRAV
jgi:hypothetical protein